MVIHSLALLQYSLVWSTAILCWVHQWTTSDLLSNFMLVFDLMFWGSCGWQCRSFSCLLILNGWFGEKSNAVSDICFLGFALELQAECGLRTNGNLSYSNLFYKQCPNLHILASIHTIKLCNHIFKQILQNRGNLLGKFKVELLYIFIRLTSGSVPLRTLGGGA